MAHEDSVCVSIAFTADCLSGLQLVAARRPDETWRSNSRLRGQATHEHFSIEASAVAMPVRTTVAPSEFLTRINALSLFSMRTELLPGTTRLVRRTAKLLCGTTLLVHLAVSERQQ